MMERFNMVDMGKIDLLESNGSVVPGIYQKITEAVNSCGDAIFYNWMFAGISIPPYPQHVLTGDPITINGVIEVTSSDLITVHGLNPETVVLVGLIANQNKTYLPSDYGADGFSSVDVDVESPQPTLIPLLATENKTYSPSDYNADGFNVVTVEVNPPEKEAIHIWTHSTGGNNASLYIQEGVLSGDSFSPTSEVYDVPYNTAQNNGRDFNIVNVKYGPWTITALDTVIYNFTEFLPGAVVDTWQYNASKNFILYKGD